jgi:hypothetical protein
MFFPGQLRPARLRYPLFLPLWLKCSASGGEVHLKLAGFSKVCYTRLKKEIPRTQAFMFD